MKFVLLLSLYCIIAFSICFCASQPTENLSDYVEAESYDNIKETPQPLTKNIQADVDIFSVATREEYNRRHGVDSNPTSPVPEDTKTPTSQSLESKTVSSEPDQELEPLAITSQDQDEELNEEVPNPDSANKNLEPIAADQTKATKEPASIPVDLLTSKPKKTKTHPKFKNAMHRFKITCPMHKEPNHTSTKVGSVRAGKKLWVENHNVDWAKVYKKSGAVYIPKNCL